MDSCFKVNMQEDELCTWKRRGLGITESKRPHVWFLFSGEVKTNLRSGGRLLLSMCVLLFNSPVYVSIKIL